MNKPAKKPAVVAKTAPKKRGRPVGSKNQKIVMTYEKPFKVDWEKLAKQLQVALSSEIKDNDAQQQVIDNLDDEIIGLIDEMNRSRTFFERLVCLFTGKV